MNPTLAVTRFGVLGLACALVAASPLYGRAASQYDMLATMKSTAGTQRSATGSMELRATLTPQRDRSMNVGATFELQGAIQAPAVCTGDMIFANGFDP